jgi:phosphoglycerate kinase
MKLNTLFDAPILKGTCGLVRIDSDVARLGGKIFGESVFRLDSAIPTLKFLLNKKASVTIMGHRGRPEGKIVSTLSLIPVQKYLETRLKIKLHFLPNTRFDAREEKNSVAYARELAEGQEIFINESFATAHRTHASTHAITKILPSFAGIQFEKEVEKLSEVRDRARTPIVLIVGGAKLETKIPMIKNFVKRADRIFVVGAAANPFLLDAKNSLLRHKNILLPLDVVGGKIAGVYFQNLDMGRKTLEQIAESVSDARTIIWNGPAGKFERKPFGEGTRKIAHMLAHAGRAGAEVVAGGGETVTAIMQNNMIRGFSHVSTGGGAMLAFLSSIDMPVINALVYTKRR